MNWITLLLSCLIATGGFIAATYEAFATANMLQVGSFFRLRGLMAIIGGILVFTVAILSAIINPWWSSLIVLLASWILGQVFIMIFKSFSQLISPLMMLVGIIALAIHML